jgi:predicted acetyltransferase
MPEDSFIIKSKSYKVRVATAADKSQFISLWRICFNDTDSFIEWFFENRFFAEYSVCIECDGRIISAMQSMPVSLFVRTEQIRSTIVAGVCTHPDYRGLGLMKRMFSFYMHMIKSMDILAVTYKPENIKTYASLSHFPTTRTLRYATRSAMPADSESLAHQLLLDQIKALEDDEDDEDSRENESFFTTDISDLSVKHFNRCYDLYSELAPSYSGIIKRTKENYNLKLSDYASVGGKALLLLDNASLEAYCFYFETAGSLYGEEIIAESEDSLLNIVDQLHKIAQDRKLILKIPSNFSDIHESNFPCTDSVFLVSQNVMGVTDLSEFIKGLDFSQYASDAQLSSFTFAVSDPVFKDNNNTYNLHGDITDDAPVISLCIGSFVQFLCGYYSILEFEIQSEDTVKIHNRDIAESIDDLIPKCNCFIVDEY